MISLVFIRSLSICIIISAFSISDPKKAHLVADTLKVNVKSRLGLSAGITESKSEGILGITKVLRNHLGSSTFSFYRCGITTWSRPYHWEIHPSTELSLPLLPPWLVRSCCYSIRNKSKLSLRLATAPNKIVLQYS